MLPTRGVDRPRRWKLAVRHRREGRFKGKNKDGAELDAGFEHVFEIADGKVVRFENKVDDAEAWATGWSG